MRLLILTAMMMSHSTVSSNGDLEWSTNYGQAKTKAATAQRPLLVVIENPHDSSARLDEQKLAASDSQIELAKQYQLCRVDVSTAYGKRVAEAFGVGDGQLPYTAITDKFVRRITYRRAGQMNSRQWAQALKTPQVREVKRVQPQRTVSRQAPAVFSPSTIRASSGFCRT